jgi:hypothetical protein
MDKTNQAWHDVILKLHDSLSGDRTKVVKQIVGWIKVMGECGCDEHEIEQRVRSILTVYNK